MYIIHTYMVYILRNSNELNSRSIIVALAKISLAHIGSRIDEIE